MNNKEQLELDDNPILKSAASRRKKKVFELDNYNLLK